MKILAKTQRVLKAITSRNKNLPILEAVHFRKDGAIEASDSHMLLKIEGRNPSKQDFMLNLNTVTTVEGLYPDTDRLFPEDFASEIMVEVNDLRKAIPYMRALEEEKSVKGVRVTRTTTGGITLSQGGANYELAGEWQTTPAKLDVWLNAKYIREMCEVFSNNFENASCVTLSFTTDELKPVLVSNDKMKYLITPIRHF